MQPFGNKVLDVIYDAVVRPEKWDLVCDEIGAAAGGVGSILIPDDARLRAFGLPHSKALNESFEIYQRDGWYLRDERNRGISTRSLKGVMFDGDFISPQEMAKHPYYQEFLKPCGLMWFAGVEFKIDGKCWTASIQRNEEQGAFNEADRAILRTLSAHLSRAANMANALGCAQTEAALDAFDRMSVGALALDRRGLVVRFNKAAERCFADGLQLRHGHLIANDNKAQSELAALASRLTKACNLEEIGTSTSVPRPSGKRRYAVTACSLGNEAAEVFGGAQAILLILDLELTRTPPARILQTQFKLTPVEGRIAECLAAGDTMSQAAERMGIAEGTARSYLKSIFHKTDTHRQVELVALLIRFGIVPRSPDDKDD